MFGQASCGRLYVFHPSMASKQKPSSSQQVKIKHVWFYLAASSPEEESTSLEKARGWQPVFTASTCLVIVDFYWRVVTDCQLLMPQICPSKSCFSVYSSAIQLSFSQFIQLIMNKSCQCWRNSIIWPVKFLSLSLLYGTIQFIFCQLIDYTCAEEVIVSHSPCSIF